MVILIKLRAQVNLPTRSQEQPQERVTQDYMQTVYMNWLPITRLAFV